MHYDDERPRITTTRGRALQRQEAAHYDNDDDDSMGEISKEKLEYELEVASAVIE